MDPIIFDIDLGDKYEFDILGDGVNEFDMSSQIIIKQIDAIHYAGPYEVTPRVTSQILATDDRLMDDNVTVHEIPYYETSNDAGGYTAIIG